MKFFKRTILVWFGLFILMPTFISAATTGIQISPLTFNFELKTGETKTEKIIITNRNNEDLNYVIEKELFNQISEEGAPSFEGVPQQTGLTTLVDWISFPDAKEGVIKPGQEKEIPFKIDIPSGAEPGGHYAAIFAKEVKKTPEGQTKLGVASRVGALVLVSVPGKVTRSAQIEEFTFPKFVWQGPVEFSMKVKDTGTVHYDSEAKVDLKPILGKTKQVEMGTHTILPNTSRAYKGTWANKYPFGYYVLSAIAKDGNGQPVTASAVMWAIPLAIAIPVLLGLIAVIILVKYLRKHYRVAKK